MTQKQAQTIEQALKRAAAEGIRIIGRGHMTADGSRFWLVSSKDYATTNRAYIVTIAGNELHCTCKAQGICKHRSVVHVELKAEKERTEAAPICPTEEEFEASYQAAFAAVLAEEEAALQRLEAQEDQAALEAAQPAEPAMCSRCHFRPAGDEGICSCCREQYHCRMCHTTTNKLRDGVCIGCWEHPVTMAMARTYPCEVCREHGAEVKAGVPLYKWGKETALLADNTFSGSIFKSNPYIEVQKASMRTVGAQPRQQEEW